MLNINYINYKLIFLTKIKMLNNVKMLKILLKTKKLKNYEC